MKVYSNDYELGYRHGKRDALNEALRGTDSAWSKVKEILEDVKDEIHAYVIKRTNEPYVTCYKGAADEKLLKTFANIESEKTLFANGTSYRQNRVRKTKLGEYTIEKTELYNGDLGYVFYITIKVKGKAEVEYITYPKNAQDDISRKQSEEFEKERKESENEINKIPERRRYNHPTVKKYLNIMIDKLIKAVPSLKNSYEVVTDVEFRNQCKGHKYHDFFRDVSNAYYEDDNEEFVGDVICHWDKDDPENRAYNISLAISGVDDNIDFWVFNSKISDIIYNE